MAMRKTFNGRAVAATIEELAAVAHMVDRRNPPQFCGLENCARERIGMNLCRAHYLQLWKAKKKGLVTVSREYNFVDLAGMEAEPMGNNLRTTKLKCSVCGERTHARGFCITHYNDWYRGQRRLEGKN